MIHYNNDNNAYCSAVNAQNLQTREHKYSMNKYILIHKKPIFLFTFRDNSSAFIVLVVRLSKYQQIHPDIQSGAHHLFTCLFTY